MRIGSTHTGDPRKLRFIASIIFRRAIGESCVLASKQIYVVGETDIVRLMVETLSGPDVTVVQLASLPALLAQSDALAGRHALLQLDHADDAALEQVAQLDGRDLAGLVVVTAPAICPVAAARLFKAGATDILETPLRAEDLREVASASAPQPAIVCVV
jgi:FixJ family two-component response regulator